MEKDIKDYTFEYLTGREDRIKEYPFSRQQGGSGRTVFNLGDGLGDYCIEDRDADEESYPEEQQGIIIRTTKHKQGHTGPATTFLSLVDSMLLDAYYTITKNYVGDVDFDINKPLFINSKGEQYLSNNRQVDFSLFCDVCDIPAFHPHLSRHMFVGYMCNQGSLALAEYAAYTACHSKEI